MSIQVQETYKTPKLLPAHSVVKILKTEWKKNIENRKKGQITYKSMPITIISDYSTRTLKP